VPQLAAWAFRRPERAVRRALALWALLAVMAFAVAPAVRALDLPFAASTSLGATLVFTLFFLLPLRNGIGSRVGRAKWCRAGIALVAGYLSFAGGMHHAALERVMEFADEAHVHYQSIAALPLPPSAACWEGLIAAPEGVYRVQFNQFGGEPVKIQFFAEAEPNRYLAAARELPDIQKFLWFARFPVSRFFERDGQPVVQISDLRFYGAGSRPGRRTSAPSPYAGFAFEVLFTPDGRVVSDSWLRPE
jgi:hypothetical protein